MAQNRERIYIVAFKNKEEFNKFKWPQTIPLTTSVKDIIDFTNKVDERFYYTKDKYKGDIYDKLIEATKDDDIKSPAIYQWRRKYVRKNKSGVVPTLTANQGEGGHNVCIVKTKYGNICVKTPRDRNATFTPIIIEKGQTTLTGFEDKCIALYAKGMSLRDIEKILKEIYGVDINKDQITRLISAVSKETENWRNRKLKPLYVFTYADCIYVPIKNDDITSSKKAIYIIIGVDAFGFKDILGMWINQTESASFWTNVFEELKERGVKDILYMSSDGIAGFKGSLETVFPETQSQRCVVHLVRNLYSLCPKKEARQIISDYKKIYTSTSQDEAYLMLDIFKTKYVEQKRLVKKIYITDKGLKVCNTVLPTILKMWENISENVSVNEINVFLETLNKMEENLKEKVIMQN